MKAFKAQIKRRLLSRQLRLFERKLESQDVTPEKVETLFHRLSSISSGFKQLERVYPFARPDISNDLDHIVSLYGRIITLNQEHEVKSIAKKAEEVEKKISQNDLTSLFHEVDALKHHIYTFCHDNRPSKEGRQVLAQARISAKRAESVMNHKTPAPPPCSLAHVDDEIAENLIEMGYCYFSGDPEEGSLQFNLLPEKVKLRCHEHLEALGGNSLDLKEFELKWPQALLATAFEISLFEEGEGYLSYAEMKAFFKERHELDE